MSVNSIKIDKIEVDEVNVTVADITDAGAAFPAFAQAETEAAQRTALALGNVDNTSDADKPMSLTQRLGLFASGVEVQTPIISAAEFAKAAVFIYIKATAPTGSVAVDGGATHVKFLRWDNTYSEVFGVGAMGTSFSASDWGNAPGVPYSSTSLQKCGAIVPCNSAGVVTGHLTQLQMANNQITSFSAAGLSLLGILDLDSNLLTHFSGAGLARLGVISLSSNRLRSATNISFQAGYAMPTMFGTAVDLRDNLLSSAAVDAFFNTGTFPNQSARINLSSGNSAPTSASAAVRAAMSSWTIITT